MTQEEKAKAYDEALKDMSVIYLNLKGDTKLAVEHAFPELRVSWYERIRRILVESFKKANCSKVDELVDCRLTKGDILAWLEKHKEDKEELVYRLNGFMQEYIKEGKDEAEKEHRFKCYHLFWDALEDENFFEQKEQKPAEWSEKDENALVSLHELIGFGFTEKFFDAQTAYDMRNWVNTRLKSLRPHWKPSEEQISALQLSIEECERDHYYQQQEDLVSLMEDLKKLM